VAIQRRILDCFAALAMTVLLCLAGPAAGQTFPANNGSPVVDQAGILRPEQVAELKSKAEALYAQSGRAFAVATVKSLEGYPVEDYAYRLGRYWKLGSAKNDDGVLLLVAPAERKVSIATGYGAGGYMTDAMSGIIIREAILPHFKQNPPDYGGGIEADAAFFCASSGGRLICLMKRRKMPRPPRRRSSSASVRAATRCRSSSGCS
jgi:uncharacterized protein